MVIKGDTRSLDNSSHTYTSGLLKPLVSESRKERAVLDSQVRFSGLVWGTICAEAPVRLCSKALNLFSSS